MRSRRPDEVALCGGIPEADVDPAVAAAVRQAGKWLADAGYEVEEAAPPHLDEAGLAVLHAGGERERGVDG